MALFMLAKRGITCIESTRIYSSLRQKSQRLQNRDIWYKMSWKKCLEVTSTLG